MSRTSTHITDPSAATFVAVAAVPCRMFGLWADPDNGFGFDRTLVSTLPFLAVRRIR